MKKNVNERVLLTSYDWTIGTDGQLYGLTAGDQGWEATGIYPTCGPQLISDRLNELEEDIKTLKNKFIEQEYENRLYQ